MSGLRQLNQIGDGRAALAVVVIEPEVGAEDLLVPVGALGADDDGVAVGRNLNRREVDGVEELVERELGLALRGECERATHEYADCETAVLWSRIGVPGGKKGYTTADSLEASL